MVKDTLKRKLAAILSADVEGYSLLMGDDEESTIQTLMACRKSMTNLIQQYRGRVVDDPGDNLLAEFTSAVDAVNCAMEIQRQLAKLNADLPYERCMHFRIGINVGDIVEEGNRIYGDGVNIAARVESHADAGGICISGRVYDQVDNKIDIDFDFLGEHKVKNIGRPIRVYRIQFGIDTKNYRKIRFAQDRSRDLPDLPSIAVLPFDNMGNDPKYESFADMISDNIITSLCKLPSLFVIARNSSFSYKGKSTKIQKIAKELGAQYVLEGSVINNEDRVRIIAQLIEAKTGHHLWAERYDRKMKDLLDLQDDITFKIINALQIKLTDGEKARRWGRETPNLHAYEKVMQSYGHLLLWTKEGLAMTREMAEEAHSLDPQYSCACRMLGICELFEGMLGWSQSLAQSLIKAEEYLRNCLALDTLDGRTLSILGFIYTIKRQYEKAIAEGYRAISLAPNDPETYNFLAYSLHFAGNRTESIPLIERSMRLNPVVPNFCYAWLGEIYLFMQMYSNAIETFLKALYDAPNYFAPCIGLAAAYAMSNKNKMADAVVKKILKIEPRFSVEGFAQTLPFKNREDTEFLIAALQKAGLK